METLTIFFPKEPWVLRGDLITLFLKNADFFIGWRMDTCSPHPQNTGLSDRVYIPGGNNLHVWWSVYTSWPSSVSSSKHTVRVKVRCYFVYLGFPGGTDGIESSYNEGDLGSIPGSGESPREVSGYLLQYSCLENSTDSLWDYKELDATEQLTTFTFQMRK